MVLDGKYKLKLKAFWGHYLNYYSGEGI